MRLAIAVISCGPRGSFKYAEIKANGKHAAFKNPPAASLSEAPTSKRSRLWSDRRLPTPPHIEAVACSMGQLGATVVRRRMPVKGDHQWMANKGAGRERI